MGKSLNQVVRDHLEQLAGQSQSNQSWDDFEARCLETKGRLNNWKFDREEANARR